jgi:hypothetical protein
MLATNAFLHVCLFPWLNLFKRLTFVGNIFWISDDHIFSSVATFWLYMLFPLVFLLALCFFHNVPHTHFFLHCLLATKYNRQQSLPDINHLSFFFLTKIMKVIYTISLCSAILPILYTMCLCNIKQTHHPNAVNFLFVHVHATGMVYETSYAIDLMTIMHIFLISVWKYELDLFLPYWLYDTICTGNGP